MKTLILTTLMISTMANGETVTKDFDSKDLKKIQVRNGSGEVTITGAKSGKTVVVADKIKFDDTCKINMEKNGETLFVEVRESGIVRRSCVINLSITAPKNSALDLAIGSGNVDVKDVAGALTFKVGSGSVNVNGEIKELDGKSGSGDITLHGLTTGGTLAAGTGKLALSYKMVPTMGELDIKSGSGGVEIAMPKDAKIRTSFVSGSGEMTNELGDSPDGKFKISMKTGSGNLHIKRH